MKYSSPPTLLNPVPKAKRISRQSQGISFLTTIALQAALVFLAGQVHIDKPDTGPKSVRTAIRFVAAAAPRRAPATVPAPAKPVATEQPEPVRKTAPVEPPPKPAPPLVETPVREVPKPVAKKTPEKVIRKKTVKPKPAPKPVVKEPKKRIPKETEKEPRPQPVQNRKHQVEPNAEPAPRRTPDVSDVKTVEKKASTPPSVAKKTVASSDDPAKPSRTAAGNTAPRRIASATSPAPSTAVSEAKNADLLLSALTAMIERHKRYPRAAQRARLEGDVRVKVLVDGTGALKSFDLLESSGHRILDKATLEIFMRIAGKRIAVNEMERALEIVVPVRYVRR